jgi:peptide/nickel transport system ATP-binding protein
VYDLRSEGTLGATTLWPVAPVGADPARPRPGGDGLRERRQRLDILNLLDELKARYDLTLVFIAHDLAVVRHVSSRVAVMYLGKICEVGDPDALYAGPAHPYTAALLASIPIRDPGARPDDVDLLSGDLPSPVSPPSGCRFRTRCPHAQERCAAEEPQIQQVGPERYVACHFPLAG